MPHTKGTRQKGDRGRRKYWLEKNKEDAAKSGPVKTYFVDPKSLR